MNALGKFGLLMIGVLDNNTWVRQKIANFTYHKKTARMSQEDEDMGGDPQNLFDLTFSSGPDSSFLLPDGLDVLSQEEVAGQIDPKELMVRHGHSQIALGYTFSIGITG